MKPFKRRTEFNNNDSELGNGSVTLFVTVSGKATTEMTPVRAVFLSLFMMSAIGLWGFGIYSADAGTEHAVVDGYGVIAANR